MHQIGKLRRDANLRYLYQGPGRSGPGRPKTYDGKVQWDDLSRFERVQLSNHRRRTVLLPSTDQPRLSSAQSACGARRRYPHPAAAAGILFSSDTDLDAQALYRGYKARFQIEFLFRDAKQFTSLSACQARSQAKLHFHFNASMSALTLGKLEALQQRGWCPGRVFHGESQTARFQPTSAGANFSSFSPGS